MHVKLIFLTTKLINFTCLLIYLFWVVIAEAGNKNKECRIHAVWAIILAYTLCDHMVLLRFPH